MNERHPWWKRYGKIKKSSRINGIVLGLLCGFVELALLMSGCSRKTAESNKTDTAETADTGEKEDAVRTVYSYSTIDHMDFGSEESLKTSIMREVSNGQKEEYPKYIIGIEVPH